MSKSRRLQLLCAVLAFIFCLTMCAVTAFADTAEQGEKTADESAADAVLTTGTEESGAESAETDESDPSQEGKNESETDTSGNSSESKPAAESSGSAAESQTDPATSGETSNEQKSSTSNVPWKLIISVGVIILIVAVLFILSKTKTKLGDKIAKFFKDYKSELKKIVWMPWKDLLKATGIVLVVLLVAALLIGLLDYGFSSLVSLLSKIGS